MNGQESTKGHASCMSDKIIEAVENYFTESGETRKEVLQKLRDIQGKIGVLIDSLIEDL